MIEAGHTIRIARPSTDLAAAGRFSTRGPGPAALFRGGGNPETGTRDPLTAGPPDARWHLEPTAGTRETVLSSPAPEDLLAVCPEAPVSQEPVDRAVEHGGTVGAAHSVRGPRRGHHRRSGRLPRRAHRAALGSEHAAGREGQERS